MTAFHCLPFPGVRAPTNLRALYTVCVLHICGITVPSRWLTNWSKVPRDPEVFSWAHGWRWAFSSDLGLVFPIHSRRWCCPTEVSLGVGVLCHYPSLCSSPRWTLLFSSWLVGLEVRCQSQGYHRPILRNIGTLKVVYKVSGHVKVEKEKLFTYNVILGVSASHPAFFVQLLYNFIFLNFFSSWYIIFLYLTAT